MADVDKRFAAAVKIIADMAKAYAAAWSARVPPSIRTYGTYPEKIIRATAPPAYPNEIAGVRHPVFGGRGTKRPHAPWVLNEHRPFLATAADEGSEAAAAEFGNVIDDWAIKAGFR